MEHRLRNQWSYKVELPTLLKIAIAENKSIPVQQHITGRRLISALAAEAITAQANCDKVEAEHINIMQEVHLV